ncbi:MAG: hypothetical protein JWM80_1198, partial [Cyanobacteria bacterium RYN_339]|nr:hypothetical protein [Cyanobacteria bacterium RYN_339]
MGLMRQLWSIVVCLALVLGLGLSEVPRLCHGDGHGGACAMATCQCEGACTCKLDHEHERVAADVEAASVCEGGTMSADRRQALARLAASCH